VGRFGIAMGRFGHTEKLWAVLVWAVLVHGPFWSFPPKSSGTLVIFWTHITQNSGILLVLHTHIFWQKCLAPEVD